MQFEDFDKKVKEAADRHHPAYDEHAWGKMEKLLDKHLPQKEDNRRRFIFFLLLFLLIGGGTWLMISKPWEGDKKIAATNAVAEKDPASENAMKNNAASSNTNPVSDDNAEKNNENTELIPAPVNDPTISTVVNAPANTLPVKASSQRNISSKEKQDQTSFEVSDAKRRSKGAPVPAQQKSDEPVATSSPVLTGPIPIAPERSSDQKEPVSGETKTVIPSLPVSVVTDKPVQKDDPVITKTDIPENKTTETKKKEDKPKKKNSLFFTLSAGPDLSFVGSGNSSTTKVVAGAGIGFTYKERFTLRTGFYSGRKIYSAKASDYDAPPAFYQFYPYLERVDANCQVYEIPVSLSYNFGRQKNLFVSAGVSSFLMKEESYDYLYKYTPNGNTYSNNWTIKNENSHYFSVGTISAGYKHNIGKRISVMAEPYLKIPFAGVGYGKVKLNSGGVLFTVGIKAF